MISDESRVTLWYHLADLPSDERIDSWTSVFPKLIDTVFGRKALSWKFLFRSYIASLLSVVIVGLFYYRFASRGYINQEVSTFILTLLVPGSLCVNIIPDYLSILVSRMIIRKMSERPTLLNISGLLALNIVLTGVVALCGVLIGVKVFRILMFRQYGILLHFNLRSFFSMGYFPQMFEFRESTSIFFYAAFFTSIWI